MFVWLESFTKILLLNLGKNVMSSLAYRKVGYISRELLLLFFVLLVLLTNCFLLSYLEIDHSRSNF